MTMARIYVTSVFAIFLAHSLISPLVFAGEPRVLVFGRIHDDPVRSIRDRQEFVDYIASKLAPFGIAGGKIMVVEKMQLLAQALREGKVDLFHDSVAPAMILSKWAGSVPILRQWKYGEADYQGVIVVKKNSGINTLADLKGKVIAFEEPHSTSASILPRMLLEEQNLKLVQLKSPGTGKPNMVSYIYGADGSSVNVLITGRVDAATTVEREIDRLKPEIRESLKIIGRTASVPRQIIAVRKGLDPKVVKALKDLLIRMDTYPEGQGVLKRQQNTTKFDEIPPESFERLKQIEQYVFSSLGKEVDSW
jgi:phosphonate transport system substrate-binding protein